jgi:hypothetical protein
MLVAGIQKYEMNIGSSEKSSPVVSFQDFFEVPNRSGNLLLPSRSVAKE